MAHRRRRLRHPLIHHHGATKREERDREGEREREYGNGSGFSLKPSLELSLSPLFIHQNARKPHSFKKSASSARGKPYRNYLSDLAVSSPAHSPTGTVETSAAAAFSGEIRAQKRKQEVELSCSITLQDYV